ncbi:carboxyl-terminal proteinase, partial [Tanacetum coccineum]
HAVAYVKQACYGARAKLNVWAPNVTNENEFSLSQIWVISDPPGPLNTIEAGWMVYQELYGDTSPRLFIYWTNDGYQKSGCYNLMCSGFVQTNQKISLGAALAPVSTYNGTQYDIGISIWKDPKGGNWWLSLGHDLIASNLIGYWPSTLFTYLGHHANLIEFGGEVLNNQ